MNRIHSQFQELRRKRKKALIAFVTAGHPNLSTTKELVVAFEKSGVDIVELGVPFSDPLADGATIQASSESALKKGVSLEHVLQTVQQIRQKSQIPIALMTYYNPIFHYGEEKFVKKARSVGVDGVIIPDLPPEEGRHLIHLCRQNGLATIFFISPTTTKARLKRIVQASTGFIYAVSIAGITGTRKQIPQEIATQIRLVKRLTKTPVCVGFGISTPEQVKAFAKISDGVIVGSAIVKEIERNKGKKDCVAKVASVVKRLIGVL